MNKKETERHILNMIFSEDIYNILCSEEPDFILTDKKTILNLA